MTARCVTLQYRVNNFVSQSCRARQRRLDNKAVERTPSCFASSGGLVSESPVGPVPSRFERCDMMKAALVSALLLLSAALGACSSTTATGTLPAQGEPISPAAAGVQGFTVSVATASKQPLHLSSQTVAFEVGADNDSTNDYKHVVVRFHLNGLPIDGTLCQVNGNGQCLKAPSPSIEIPISKDAAVFISAFISATGPIPHGTVGVDFYDGDRLLGSGKVKVTTNS
jgi:predicted small secreted protein